MIAFAWMLAAGLAAPAVGVEGTARVVTDLLQGVSGAPRTELQEVTLRFRGDAVRFEFNDAQGRDFALLRRQPTGPYVMVDAAGGLLPVPGGPLNLVFDPQSPCAALGILSECRRLGDGRHAGREAVQWTFRHANRRGPGATDSGRMWVDRATGLVLAYTARTTGSQREHVWDVTSLHDAPVDPGWFAGAP